MMTMMYRMFIITGMNKFYLRVLGRSLCEGGLFAAVHGFCMLAERLVLCCCSRVFVVPGKAVIKRL